jgi:hypothetical protein
LSRRWLERPPPGNSISLIVDNGRTDKERVIWEFIYRNRNKRTAKERRLQKLVQKRVPDMLSATQKKLCKAMALSNFLDRQKRLPDRGKPGQAERTFIL